MTNALNLVLSEPLLSPFVIFGGDFNTEPNSNEYKLVTSRGFVESETNVTWNNNNIYAEPIGDPNRRIDYIFARECQSIKSYVLSEPYDTPLSDHACVVSDITFKIPQ